jgi:hypothetical protein
MTPNHRLSRPQMPPAVADLARQMRSDVRAIARTPAMQVGPNAIGPLRKPPQHKTKSLP